MRPIALALGLPALAIGTAAAAQPANLAGMASLRVEHAAARVVVIPEKRATIAAVIRQGRGVPPLHMRQVGPMLVIDGDLAGSDAFSLFGSGRGLSCESHGAVRVGGKTVAARDLPLITVHVPLDTRIAAGGAVSGEIGPSASLALANAGCGDWRVGEVRGASDLSTSGSGDIKAAGAGAAQVRIAGSGDVALSDVRGKLDASIAGSGDLHAARVNGPLTVRIAGSGDVTIDGGRTPNADISIAGSGDVTFGGVADHLAAKTRGSGDISVAQVTGDAEIHKAGSGDVHYGSPH